MEKVDFLEKENVMSRKQHVFLKTFTFKYVGWVGGGIRFLKEKCLQKRRKDRKLTTLKMK